jgi:WXG100 family type VII secretion target
MAGNGIEVDYVTLRTAADHVKTARDEVLGQLGQIRDQAEIMAGGWQGDAGSSFQSLISRWGIDARNLTDAMQEIADTLNKSAGAHQRADEESKVALNKITSTLNPS